MRNSTRFATHLAGVAALLTASASSFAAVATSPCQGLVLSAAYIAVPGPNGIDTIPMTPDGSGGFTIARGADWPAAGHIRLAWSLAPGAPSDLLTAVDVGADPVLLDGVAVADAFLGSQVATAIQNVSLDPAQWPHVVTLALGAVPAGSACPAISALPAVLTVTGPTAVPIPIDPVITTVPAITPLPAPVPRIEARQ